jgi:hypothetical protein
MREKNDWRLKNQERYLKGVTLIRSRYQPAKLENDHDHCEFCDAKFMRNANDALQEGYCMPDRSRWICKTCFDDFADLFAWKVTNPA